MFISIRRFLLPYNSYINLSSRLINQAAPNVKGKYGLGQLDYIKSVLQDKVTDWSTLKDNVLSKEGRINQKNYDGILLKVMINSNNLDKALSFAEHLKTLKVDLTLGSINGLLNLYYHVGKNRQLSDTQKEFILSSYKTLYRKYKVLDYRTCEILVTALCTINEWEMALKVLDDIHLSTTPSHLVYSTLISTLFKLNNKKKAYELIENSINNKRPLQHIAYEEWINYILRNYKENKTIVKYLNEIFYHISQNSAVITLDTANKFKDVYLSLNWKAEFTEIKKLNGECKCCKSTLDCLNLSEEEFQALQQNVKEKLIVGSDLLLKTSPTELTRFTDFINKTAPYDIVLDALNIALAVRNRHYMQKFNILNFVVDHFLKKNKKILLLGRKHMLKWSKRDMEKLMAKTCHFFTEDLSQDDPYFITAALLSGSHTDLLSKDLFRNHRFMLKDDHLGHLFKRWQWQHQWMIQPNAQKGLTLLPPLTFTPCAQNKNNCWHLPYEKQEIQAAGLINDGTPDLSSWICLRSNVSG